MKNNKQIGLKYNFIWYYSLLYNVYLTFQLHTKFRFYKVFYLRVDNAVKNVEKCIINLLHTCILSTDY